METRVERLGYDVSFNPPGHGDFFYASAAQALGVETKDLKKVTFDFLKSHQFDVSIQLTANSRTNKDKSVVSIGSEFYRNTYKYLRTTFGES